MATASLPWSEKYRPRTFDEVVGHTRCVAALRRALHTLDSLILAGPPGTGKTTCVGCLVEELRAFGVSDVLRLNGSLHTDKSLYTKQLVQFHHPGRKSLVVVEEADRLLPATQALLVRLLKPEALEDGAPRRFPRFVFLCNEPDKLLAPLRALCGLLFFPALPRDLVRGRLEEVARLEGVTVEPEGWNVLIQHCEGDLRQSLNLLQSVSRALSSLSASALRRHLQLPNPVLLSQVVSHCLRGDCDSALSVARQLWQQGFTLEQLVQGWVTTLQRLDAPPSTLLALVSELSETHAYLSHAPQTRVQLEALVCRWYTAVGLCLLK